MFEQLFPQESASLEALASLSNQVADAAALLSEMVGSHGKENYPEVFANMLEHESQSQNTFFTAMTQVRSSFAPPLPREDLYTLANHLMTAVERLTSAGHVLTLLKIDRFTSNATTLLDLIQREAVLTSAIIPRLGELKGTDEYWMDMIRLSRQATRTGEVYKAEILDLYKTDRYLKTVQFVEELTGASQAMRSVSTHIGRIIVQES